MIANDKLDLSCPFCGFEAVFSLNLVSEITVSAFMDLDHRQRASAGVKLPSLVASGDGQCFNWQGSGRGLKDCNNGLIT